MKPAEELFRLGDDRTELRNLAGDPAQAEQLAAMRRAFDAELARMKQNAMPGRAYEVFPALFARDVPWERKAPLLTRLPSPTAAGEGEGGAKKKNRKDR
ncbi:MAG: hypothetical protein HC841_07985 [Verrucomicrobiae bacterium]|nr:hypothetical protein [Verrucomicrobiae bacterium]